MQGTPEGRDSGGDGRIQVGLGGADNAHGRRAAVLLVVRVKDQELVDGAVDDRIDFVIRRRQAEHHVQEVLRVGQVVGRVHHRVAHVVLVALGRQRGQLGDEPVDGQLDVLHGAVRILAVRVEGGQGGGHGAQHAHRVGAERERIEEALHVLVHEGVHLDAAFKPIEPLLIGQVAVDQEVGHLHKGRLLGQILNAVSTVAQDALLAIEEGDAAQRRPRVLESAVERDEPRLSAELGDVQRHLAFRSPNNGQFNFLVFEGQAGVFTHGYVRCVPRKYTPARLLSRAGRKSGFFFGILSSPRLS